MPSTQLKTVLAWVELLLWMALIYHLSGESFTAPRTLYALQYWNQFLGLHLSPDRLLSAHHVLRKLAHFGEFFILGLLLHQALSSVRVPGSRMVWVLALGMAYALSDELHQIFVPTRGASLRDSLLDSSGVLASQIWLAARGWRSRRVSPRPQPQ